MRIGEVRAVDVRGSLTAQRGRLLSLLASLSDAQWAAATAAPRWSVKDIALHLVDGDLSWLARNRDHNRTGNIPAPSGHEEFVRGQPNQRWVDGTRTLSPQLITGLMQWSGDQLDAYLGTVDLACPSSVYWAGEVPLWFDLAREFTERWVHYQQIREAARPGGHDHRKDGYLPLVLRTFIWGFPHQYHAPAPAGTTIALDVTGIGAWTLTRTATGWTLDERPGRRACRQPADDRGSRLAAAHRRPLRHAPGAALGRACAGGATAPSPRHHCLALQPGRSSRLNYMPEGLPDRSADLSNHSSHSRLAPPTTYGYARSSTGQTFLDAD